MDYNFDCVSDRFRSLIEPLTKVGHTFDADLEARQFDEAYILPYIDWQKSVGTLADSSGKTIHNTGGDEFIEDSRLYKIGGIETKPQTVIYLGFLLNIFGHTFTDNLSKMWYLRTSEAKELLENGAILAYTTAYNHPLTATTLQIFKMAGFDLSNAVHITKPERYTKIIVPDDTFKSSPHGRICCPEYLQMINTIKESVPAVQTELPQKIYFTRTRFRRRHPRREAGERSVEKVFKALGYTVISPERYSFTEQLQMVANCTHLATSEGSIAHLALFCKPGTQLTILSKAYYANEHQPLINECADINVTYVEAHNSFKANKEHPWWGPFYMCVTPYLQKFAGLSGPLRPIWACRAYWYYLIFGK